MLLIYGLLLFLQLELSHNIESECGCGVSNERRSAAAQSAKTCNIESKNEDDNEKFEQCTTPDQNKYNINQFLKIKEMVLIPSGHYQVGTNDMIIEKDNEGPEKIVHIKSFYLDKYEVSNKKFKQFAKITNYKTEAETFGDSFVFGLFLNDTFKDQLKDFRVVQATWWYKVVETSWKQPYGPDSNISEHMDHPVVHVSWKDAKAYCEWRGARLPTEAEWEAGCRGGHRGTKYPWGDKLFPDKKYMANIWQGTFPNYNSAKDGYIGTNPVNNFPANDFGLYNMAGNVWEWTEDSWSESLPQEKVKKGGSYLCHKSYCYRYRCSARSHNTEDSSAGNLGFRCAKSL